MKRFCILVATLVALFFGVGGVLPALAKMRDLGSIPSAFVGSYTLGVALLSAFCATAVFYAIERRRKA
jgi:hypothetical protein